MANERGENLKDRIRSLPSSAVRMVLLGIGLVVILLLWMRHERTETRSLVEIKAEVKEESTEEKTAEPSTEESAVPLIGVDVTGAVNMPDQVWMVPEGSRVMDVIALAGGAREDADLSKINLAAYVADGQKIRVPFVGEAEETAEEEKRDETKHLTNINLATKIELMELPGIGEAMAERIIAYREANGGFARTEEIMNVSGIGQAKWEALKDLITVD